MAALYDAANLDLLPLTAPPDGLLPNFTNPPDRSHQLFIVAGVCLFLIVSFASLRFYAKFSLLRKRTKDDYAYVLTLASAITLIALYISLVTGPVYGLHSWDVLLKNLSVGKIQQSLVLAMLYGPAIWMIKLSLFLLILELFGTLKWLRYLVYGGILVTGMVYFSIMIAIAAACSPRKGFSKGDYLVVIADPKCARNDFLNTWPGIFNILSDFYLLVIPLPAVWGLQLPTRKKIGISAMFLTGLTACVCSIMSLVYRLILRRHHDDNTWYFIPLSIVIIAEVTAGVIIPSIPATSVVYRHLKPTFSSRTLLLSQKLKSVRWSRTPSENSTGETLEMGSARNHYRVINENPVKPPSATIKIGHIKQPMAKDNART